VLVSLDVLKIVYREGDIPAPGMMARRVSGRATVAVEANTRKLVQRPSSRPPPKAELPMAEMVGIGRVDRRVKVLLNLVKNCATLFVSYQHTGRMCCTIESGCLLLFRRHAQSLLQVGASAEGIVGLAGQDQSSRAALAALFVQALYDSAQFTQQLLRDGVSCFGTVER
jgi:hypothetical protein